MVKQKNTRVRLFVFFIVGVVGTLFIALYYTSSVIAHRRAVQVEADLFFKDYVAMRACYKKLLEGYYSVCNVQTHLSQQTVFDLEDPTSFVAFTQVGWMVERSSPKKSDERIGQYIQTLLHFTGEVRRVA